MHITHLSQQFVCFIRLTARANYDLSNIIVFHFVRLVVPFTLLEKVVNILGRLSAKNNSAELIVYNAFKIVFLVTRFG